MHPRLFRAVVYALAAAAFSLAMPSGAAAQLAHAGNCRLEAYVLDAAGGGTASLNVAAHTSLGETGRVMSAGLLSAQIGFLGANDPQTSNAPVVFGVQPAFGPKAGGTPISISGMNFGKFGTAANVSVTIGGQPVSDLVVQSETLITATTPAGSSGPHDVVVSGGLGASPSPGTFLHTPAITTTPVVDIGGTLVIRNYGPVGGDFQTVVSLTPWSAPTKFGPLLVGPVIFTLISTTAYPPSDGVHALPVPVPNEPVLHGLTVYFQSLSITGFGPLQGALTNASATAIP
jgi:hypothetical protein